MSAADWLARYTHPRSVIATLGRPARITVDGQAWTVATDHAVVVAVRGAEEGIEGAAEPGLEGFVQRACGGVEVPLSRLRAWTRGGQLVHGWLSGVGLLRSTLREALSPFSATGPVRVGVVEAARGTRAVFVNGGEWRVCLAECRGVSPEAPRLELAAEVRP